MMYELVRFSNRTPAVHCSMPEIDRIFSRIGTSDDIQVNQSENLFHCEQRFTLSEQTFRMMIKTYLGTCCNFMQTNSSTFFIEMREMSNIINNATAQSLVLVDELGRCLNCLEIFEKLGSIHLKYDGCSELVPKRSRLFRSVQGDLKL